MEFETKLSQVNNSWRKDLIIRYVIVEMAPFFQRDLFYFLSSPEKQLELFKSGYRPLAPDVFCITLCENYQKILSRFDIRSKVIQSSGISGNTVPLFALIVEGDNGWYYINPLKDLWSHQLKLESNEYGVIGYNNRDYVLSHYPYLQTLDANYIHGIDEEIGLKNNNPLFAPNVIGGKNVSHYRKVKGIEKGAPITDTIISKIGDINDKYLNIGCVRGPIERNLMYKFFVSTVCTKPERSLLKVGFNPDENYAVTIKVATDEDIIFFQEVKDENDNYSIVRR